MIKELRKLKGLNQARLGELMGVKAASVSDWETGKTRPDIRKLQELARVLGTSVDVLTMAEEPSGQYVTPNVRAVKAGRIKSTPLPLISIRGQASVIEHSLEGCQLQFIEDFFPVSLPDLELDEAKHVVIEIEGDSMEPDIKSRAKVLAEHVDGSNIKYESNAVYAVLYGNRFVVKRIKSNDMIEKGRLVLHSDNDRYGPITVHAEDVRCMWKVLRIVDSPVY